MKRGHVVGISRKLPSDGVFSNYEAIRKHWKVMVGHLIFLNCEKSMYHDILFIVRMMTNSDRNLIFRQI